MKELLRVCLVNPKLEGPYPPLGIGYLASYLRKYGGHSYAIKIVDGNCCVDIFREIIGFKPDLVGFTALSPQIKEAIDLSWELKKYQKDIFQVIGGIHVSALPEETLEKAGFEVGVLGEGEETFCELVDLFAQGKLSIDALRKIEGVCFKDEGSFYRSQPRPEISKLDMIPPPDRGLFNMQHYLSYRLLVRGLTGDRITTVMGSRGCPYNCTFCSSKNVFKGVRQFSPEYIIAELKGLIKDYNVKAVFFTDDTFTINKERIRKFCNLLIDEGINRRLKWDVQGRADLINWKDLELLKLMKRAGCTQIDYGFESGSEKILGLLKKDRVKLGDNQRAIAVTKAAGLSVMATFMLGTPGETEADLKETEVFIEKNINHIDYFQTFIATPYPGTELYDICKEKGIVSTDYLKEIEKERMQKGRILVYTDTAAPDGVIKTLRHLNKIAAAKIRIREKIGWLICNLIRNPFRVFDAIRLHYFG